MLAKVFRPVRHAAHIVTALAVFGTLPVMRGLAANNVTLAWDASTDPTVTGYNLYYGGGSGNYTNTINAGSATSAGVSNVVVGTTYYFAATCYNAAGLESDYSAEAAYTVPAAGASNVPPTLNLIGNVTINENAGAQTVNLSGITPGSGTGVGNLSITALSSNPALIPNPSVFYTSPSTTGTLSFTPALFGFGSSTITVTANNGGVSNNVISRAFTVTVNAVNQPPTLNPIGNLTINENAGQQTVNLSGISSGASNEVQTLTVSAFSSNLGVIPNPTVSYISPNTTGTLTFTPVANAAGAATITVMVDDGGATSNTIIRSFTVTVNPWNVPPTLNPLANLVINENAGMQTVNLSGITSGATNEIQALRVTASSGNLGLIPSPTVSYTTPSTTGNLTFAPFTNASGSATITVTVNDGQPISNLFSRTFTVTVNLVQSTNSSPTNAWTLWWQSTNGGLAVWSMTGTNQASVSSLQPAHVSTGWQVVGTGDFNGDGQPDLLWEKDDGSLALWFMSGTNMVSVSSLQPGRVSPGWRVVGVADFNGDGQPDILWEKDDGSLACWFMNGTTSIGLGEVSPGKVTSPWRVVATLDLNGDGQPDILWEKDDGSLACWFMNGTTCVGLGELNPGKVTSPWRVVGAR